jgi:serine/threonine protein kinase
MELVAIISIAWKRCNQGICEYSPATTVMSEVKTTQQLNIGSTLTNRYLIENVIGVGGMGAVYRARDLHFPGVTKHVAVKEMIIQTQDPTVRNTIVRNFEREANLLATLDHPSIPRIYDYFSAEDRSYLVLEFINGKDLEAIIEAQTLEEDHVVRWSIQICDVLHYLHTHQPEPIIFRDLKPSNIMINQHDRVMLIDFGIAKPFETGQKGTMIGTEGYSPPEQYRGEATQPADIYAFGATLHHLLTKRDPRIEPPFTFGERPIRDINPNVSPELVEIVYRALQYDPANRFTSALEMKEAFLGLARQTHLFVNPASEALYTHNRNSGLDPVWTFTCQDEIRGMPAVIDDVVLFGSYDRNLYALDGSTGELRWSYQSDGGIVSKPIVVEGDVYFGSEDQRLHVVNFRSGKINWTQYTDGPIRSSPYFAEGHVFIGSDDGCLHAFNIATGRQTWQMEAGAPIRSTPVVHEDSILFGTEMGDLFCVDFKSNVKWHFKAKRAVTSSPVVANHSVYFGSVDGTIYALDIKSGWVLWRKRLGKATISTPFILDEMLYTGAVNGEIYCIDTRSSKEVWHFATGHQVTGSPVIFQDRLYCGSVDGNIYCLENHTGKLIWKYQTGGAITGTPAISGNLIYIGSTDHKFYALTA